MAKRYELPDAAWEMIADLVSPEQKMGRPRSDERLMLHFLEPVLRCSLARPARAVRPVVDGVKRFRDWRDDSTFDQVLEFLHIRLKSGDLDRLGYLDD